MKLTEHIRSAWRERGEAIIDFGRVAITALVLMGIGAGLGYEKGRQIAEGKLGLNEDEILMRAQIISLNRLADEIIQKMCVKDKEKADAIRKLVFSGYTGLAFDPKSSSYIFVHEVSGEAYAIRASDSCLPELPDREREAAFDSSGITYL